MKTALISGLVLSLTVVMAPPALAKKQSGKISGIYCAQGPDNAHIPASSLKPAARNKLRKGQKVKFNYPGYGPITCTAY